MMKISELVSDLNSILAVQGDLEVIAARDAEGNGFNYVISVSWDGYDAEYGEVFDWEDVCTDGNVPHLNKVVILDVDG